MISESSSGERPRPLGRPRDPAKVESILTASWRLFLKHGVEPVAVETIAAEAGVSKATVYAYFDDKRAMFQEGVRREMAKIEAAQRLDEAAIAGTTLRDVLIRFGTGIMTFLTGSGAVDFYGSLSGELRRDPQLARMFYDAGPGRTVANLAAILSSPLASDLEIADANSAAEMLLGMWQGMTNYQLMLGIDHKKVTKSIPKRVTTGVDLFLKSHAQLRSSNH
ncbi:TetR/AcrR family transcriptional regulator [Telmatocola sphagniphila]|uniref:TetR/AcrR family transcriptional regulator n=1 Tax=Telmatocola sphagniphila TaxID=1123043 RepID=A0A8E6B3P9_9BACT|nr:TetR/AcrR family transcriptional regulator [Telmatocola sphagniphila]QVL31620.1 TetR/AcrR family transcriptional regulator [Telmatocola sphagniphila]